MISGEWYTAVSIETEKSEHRKNQLNLYKGFIFNLTVETTSFLRNFAISIFLFFYFSENGRCVWSLILPAQFTAEM